MANNLVTRVQQPLSQVTAPLVGENLLQAFKDLMIGNEDQQIAGQSVFRVMFGERGERVFVNDVPSYNDTIVPLLELYWQKENFESWDTYLTGSVLGRIVLPAMFRGNYNQLRQVAAVFHRFLGSRACAQIFQTVTGLVEFGAGTDFAYDKLLRVDGLLFPTIEMTLPFKFDLAWFAQQNPDLDVRGDLDAELFGAIQAYRIGISSEEGKTLIPDGTLVQGGT